MLNSDLVIGISSLVITAVAWSASRDLSRWGRIFVDCNLIILGALGAIMFIKGLVKPERVRFFESSGELNNILIGLAIIAVYLFFIPRMGFLLSSYVFYGMFNWFLGENKASIKHIIQSVVLSVVVVTTFYFVFRYVFEVILPVGSWFEE
jgi:hypothetical protein